MLDVSLQKHLKIICLPESTSAHYVQLFLCRDGGGSVGTSKWIFPQERKNPFPMEAESTSSVNNSTPVAELNNTNSTHDVSNISITSVRQLDIN